MLAAIMGHVATNDNVQEYLGIQQQSSDNFEFLVIPTTPDHTPEVTMTDPDDTHALHEGEEIDTEASPCGDQKSAARGTEITENNQTEEISAGADADDDESPYASLDPKTILVIPITNPSVFPVQRLSTLR